MTKKLCKRSGSTSHTFLLDSRVRFCPPFPRRGQQNLLPRPIRLSRFRSCRSLNASRSHAIRYSSAAMPRCEGFDPQVTVLFRVISSGRKRPYFTLPHNYTGIRPKVGPRLREISALPCLAIGQQNRPTFFASLYTSRQYRRNQRRKSR